MAEIFKKSGKQLKMNLLAPASRMRRSQMAIHSDFTEFLFKISTCISTLPGNRFWPRTRSAWLRERGDFEFIAHITTWFWMSAIIEGSKGLPRGVRRMISLLETSWVVLSTYLWTARGTGPLEFTSTVHFQLVYNRQKRISKRGQITPRNKKIFKYNVKIASRGQGHLQIKFEVVFLGFRV